jgi:DNA adenine methylase
MKYMGGKHRHAKQIIAAIMKDLDGKIDFTKKNIWIEPFVGGANVIDKVDPNIFMTRFGFDINGYVMTMFRSLANGSWVPPTNLSEEQYYELKEKYQNGSDHYSSLAADIAFAAVACSYGGKWWGGYARGNTNKGTPRNYAREAHDHLMKQKEKLTDTFFLLADYKDVDIISGMDYNYVIYCDPPYRDTTKYDFSKNFDHDDFWKWCDQMVTCGHTVYVSEYDAPEGWTCIWSKENVNSSLTKNTGVKKLLKNYLQR